MPNFWGPKKDKKAINSSTKCLISVKIAILTPHIIPPPFMHWWMFGWYLICRNISTDCVFLEVNPCFQKAHIFCMDLQPAADPYNVVCTFTACNQYLLLLIAALCFIPCCRPRLRLGWAWGCVCIIAHNLSGLNNWQCVKFTVLTWIRTKSTNYTCWILKDIHASINK